MNASWPPSDPPGSPEQALAEASILTISVILTGPRSELIAGPLLTTAAMNWRLGGTSTGPDSCSGFASTRALVVAATVIAAGEVPGLVMVAVAGPSLPAATTTVTPALTAAVTALA